MRIIFSRKGFDSGAGGAASALLDDRPITFPIPSSRSCDPRYGELPLVGEMIADLTRSPDAAARSCHLDPDLDARSRPRQPGWRGALGQVAAAQGHLSRQGVREGDLFVFWGLFRPVARRERWEYTGPARHCIFGWLQIGEVVTVGTDPSSVLERYPWLHGHPHTIPGDWPNNTIYVARPTLDVGIACGVAGWGTFSRASALTCGRTARVSDWNVPSWLNPTCGGTGMSYNPLHRWTSDGRLTAASRGQEFVADIGDRVDAREWVADLIRSHA